MGSQEDILSMLEKLNADTFIDETERLRVRDGLQKALRKISKPFEVSQEHVNWYFTEIAVVRALIFAGVFQKWAQNSSEKLTVQELAELTGADVVLLRRLLRAAASVHLFNEVDYDTYSRSPWAIFMGEEPAMSSRYDAIVTKLNLPNTNALPYFLKDTGFKNPTDVEHSAFQHSHGQVYFDYVASDPDVKATFHETMTLLNKYTAVPWSSFYPIKELISEAKPDRPILVDVGGGKGNDVKVFLSSHPDAPTASVIVQDRAEVLKLIDDPVLVQEGGPVKLMTHDFFLPQPVKGARAYLMHRILHDWPDEKAEKILRQVAAAMEKGYSKLLIYDIVLSDRKPTIAAVMADISMMRQFSSKERSESEFRELLESTGMKVVKIWADPRAVDCIVEAELV
ncbi:hypothetical protein N0V93_009355 [Gnomoniopsis smithogilvyi]|uniref:O-methyltransferase n=1 Tax=Gnomoniopsis smithogilvyi TaxID=1191159 RepID=A0A9W9CTQ5_9PEZI|nr:hypothetical protein N0V93_009355 [Gnomoniopsis smithogilvyi]